MEKEKKHFSKNLFTTLRSFITDSHITAAAAAAAHPCYSISQSAYVIYNICTIIHTATAMSSCNTRIFKPSNTIGHVSVCLKRILCICFGPYEFSVFQFHSKTNIYLSFRSFCCRWCFVGAATVHRSPNKFYFNFYLFFSIARAFRIVYTLYRLHKSFHFLFEKLLLLN